MRENDFGMIRSADQKEAGILTRLSFASKGYWHYPSQFFQIWKDELTVTPADIEKNDVHVFEKEGKILGYYSLVELKEDLCLSGCKIEKGLFLEHMFVLPVQIGRGIGTALFEHLRRRCQHRSIHELKILADPHSRGFYEKMGCRYHREVPSTIAGRTTPLLSLDIS